MKLKTANEMTIEAQAVFNELRSGQIKHKEAAEMVNAIGKMIGLAKIQLEYAHLRQEKPEIPFLVGNPPVVRHTISDEEPRKTLPGASVFPTAEFKK